MCVSVCLCVCASHSRRSAYGPSTAPAYGTANKKKNSRKLVSVVSQSRTTRWSVAQPLDKCSLTGVHFVAVFFFLFGCVSLLSVVRPRLLLFRYFPPVLPPFVFNGFFLFTKRNTLRTRSKPVKHSSAATRSVKLSGNSVNTSHVTAVGHFPLDFFGLIFHL